MCESVSVTYDTDDGQEGEIDTCVAAVDQYNSFAPVRKVHSDCGNILGRFLFDNASLTIVTHVINQARQIHDMYI